jgi:hypothetical protein
MPLKIIKIDIFEFFPLPLFFDFVKSLYKKRTPKNKKGSPRVLKVQKLKSSKVP